MTGDRLAEIKAEEDVTSAGWNRIAEERETLIGQAEHWRRVAERFEESAHLAHESRRKAEAKVERLTGIVQAAARGLDDLVTFDYGDHVGMTWAEANRLSDIGDALEAALAAAVPTNTEEQNR